MTQQHPADDPLSSLGVDPASSVPAFRQLHDWAVAAVRDGRLHPGQQLPTVRALASSQGLAPNTVAKAYKSLEEAGIIEGRGRAGTFVRLGDDPVAAAGQRVALEAAAAFSRLGIEADRAARLLRDAFEAQ